MIISTGRRGVLLDMAFLALGRTALHFNVAPLTIVMENFLCFGGCFAIMAVVAVGEFTLVVAGGTVGIAFLVSSVVESDSAHACFQSDFSRSLVIGDNRHRSNSNQTSSEQQNHNLLHVYLPWVMALCLVEVLAYSHRKFSVTLDIRVDVGRCRVELT